MENTDVNGAVGGATLPNLPIWEKQTIIGGQDTGCGCEKEVGK